MASFALFVGRRRRNPQLILAKTHGGVGGTAWADLVAASGIGGRAANQRWKNPWSSRLAKSIGDDGPMSPVRSPGLWAAGASARSDTKFHGKTVERQ
jgi:hypothetical protein